MLCIQKYDAQIKYAPGKDVPGADALSWISSCHGDAVQGLDPTQCQPNKGGSDTGRDRQGCNSALCEDVMSGWPEKRYDCPAFLSLRTSSLGGGGQEGERGESLQRCLRNLNAAPSTSRGSLLS